MLLASLVPSRAVEHPSVPEDPEYVRVRTYESQMVIRPHKTFDEVRFGGGKRSGKLVKGELPPAPAAAPRGTVPSLAIIRSTKLGSIVQNRKRGVSLFPKGEGNPSTCGSGRI